MALKESVCCMQCSRVFIRKRLKKSECKQLNISVIIFLDFFIYQAGIPQIPSALDELLEQTQTLSRIYSGVWLSGSLPTGFSHHGVANLFFLFACLKLKSATTEIICTI